MRSARIILIGWVLQLSAPMLSSAESPAEKFRIQAAGGAITGSEEYRIVKADTGYRLTGKTKINQTGRSLEMDQIQDLDADWTVTYYRLNAEVMGQAQQIEVRIEGNQAMMRASAGETSQSNSVSLTPTTVVLDNLLVSHYQILMNAMAGKVEAGSDWSLLIPQRLAVLKGKIATGNLEKATLGGKTIDVRKYILEAASLLVEMWVEDNTNTLMRVTVPLQKVEMVREGYAPAAAPPEAKAAGVEERNLTFPSGALQLPATLTVPASAAGKVPLVVLVHGSGPNDRDETIGPNRPFRDLAHGLAAAGIASLRYDKRTFAFRDKVDKMITLDQEVTDDAVAALEFARSLPEVRPEALFLIGHSMGGMMAPFIAQRFPALRGVVLMAGTARPLDQLIYEQIAFQSRLAGLSDNQVEMKVSDLKMAFARVRSGEALDGEVILAAPAHYWRDSFRFDIPKALAELKPAVLVLQGGKDVQVGKADYELILKSLSARAEAERESHWFDNLNHLFIAVEGQPTGAEYGRAGHVDSKVIETIAGWIRKKL